MGKLRKIALAVLMGLAVVITVVWVAAQFANIAYRSNVGFFEVGPSSIHWGDWIYNNSDGWRGWRMVRADTLGNDWYPVIRMGFPWRFNAPYWLMLVVVLVLAASIWWLSDHEVDPLRCEKCNYNLTGNTTGVCPECGKPCDSASSSRGHPGLKPPA